MKDLIEYIAKALVDNPEAVEVSEVEGTKNICTGIEGGKRGFGKSDWKTGQICPGHENHFKCGIGKVEKTNRAGDCGISKWIPLIC